MAVDPMRATKAISEFLRHLNARDLPDAELFALKADAFDLMADQYDEDGPAFAEEAAECRRRAAEARSVAEACADA